jgi:hypothetical protein
MCRRSTTRFLASVQSRVSAWERGGLFLYYSGHGAYAPSDAIDAASVEPALVFAQGDDHEPSRWLFWREIFAKLALPPSVRLALLPDC